MPSLAVFLSLEGLAASSSESGQQACQLQGQTFAPCSSSVALGGLPPEAGKVNGRNSPSLAVFLSLVGLAAPSFEPGQARQLQGQTFALCSSSAALGGSPPESGKMNDWNLPSLAGVFLSLVGLAAPSSSEPGQACQLQGQAISSASGAAILPP